MKFQLFLVLFLIEQFVSGASITQNVSQSLEPKVVGGQQARPHEFPFLVDILAYQEDVNLGHYCSGIVINSGWILTTSLCMDWSFLYRIEIIAGIHNREELEESAQKRQVIFEIRHPDYVNFLNHNDLEVLRIFPDLEFNEFVGAAELVKSDFIPTNATIIGWGSVTEKGPLSNLVRKTNVQLISKEVCNSTYNYSLGENTLCYGDEIHNACTGDEGGPVVSFYSHEVMGITSETKCDTPLPTITTEIAPFTDWIQAMTIFHREDESPVIIQTDICGGAFDASAKSGKLDFFSSSKFPNNTKCTWSISSSLSKIRFRITTSNPGLRDDLFVTQYDPIKRSISTTIPITSLNEDVTVDGPLVFLTLNGAYSSNGFVLEFYAKGYESEQDLFDGKNIHLSNTTEVESYYGYFVDKFERAIYILNPKDSQSLTLRWRYIELDDDEDKISFYAWENNAFVLVNTYNGSQQNLEPQELSEGLGLIIFMSEYEFVSNTAFSFAYYTELLGEDSVPSLIEKDTCGGIINSSSGQIDFFSESSYGDGINCIWIIHSSMSETRFRLTKSGLVVGDNILVSEWDEQFLAPGNTTYLSAVGQDIVFKGPTLILTFVGTSTTPSTGFSLEFFGSGIPFADGDGITSMFYSKDEQGSLKHPEGNEEYENVERAFFILNPNYNGNTTMTLTWTKMMLDFFYCPHDSVNIYVWNNNSYELQSQHCGEDIPPPDVVLSNLVIIVFQSDFKRQNPGFAFYWENAPLKSQTDI